MHIAKLRWPNNDRRSLLEIETAADQDLIAPSQQANLSSGSDAFMSTLSSEMPRNSKSVEGLTVFFSETGTPNSRKTFVTVEIQQAGGDEVKSLSLQVL